MASSLSIFCWSRRRQCAMSARELILAFKPAVVDDVDEVGDVDDDDDGVDEMDADVDVGHVEADEEAENLRNSRRMSKYSKK